MRKFPRQWFAGKFMVKFDFLDRCIKFFRRQSFKVPWLLN